MPYPQNLETAKEVENVVKENGATPATIAILGGVPHIGKRISVLLRVLPKFFASFSAVAVFPLTSNFER